MTHPIKTPKKLIEVALPIYAINAASVRESYIYRANPSSIHKWWAQRPLAAARAVIFAQLVNDPSWKWELEHPEEVPPNQMKASWAASRKRLFSILEDLVKWESATNEDILEKARGEISKSWRETCELNRAHPNAANLFNPDKLPAFYDPFAGGGTIPLEAQRLGLEAFAFDLNPVAVLINKALIEIPQKFAGRPPVGPLASLNSGSGELHLPQAWDGTEGLAEDVRRYGAWIQVETERRVGHLYPPIHVTAQIARDRPDLKAFIGKKLKVIAYLWARTLKSPNPGFRHIDVPLASTFMLSTKPGREAYVKPVIEGAAYRFTVKMGKPEDTEGAKNGTKLARGANFRCLMSDTPIASDYIMAEGKAGRMRARLMAVVADGAGQRVYLPPSEEMEVSACQADPQWKPEIQFFQQALGFRVGNYGMTQWSDLFTPRQLAVLTTFSDLVSEALDRVMRDALTAGMPDGQTSLATGGTGARAYAEAVAVYLAFVLSKTLDYNCALVPWYTKEDRPGHLFSKQAIPMVWDYVEVNPLSDIGGGFTASSEIVADALRGCPGKPVLGRAQQCNAVGLRMGDGSYVVSTDPPYYDNVPYADLSDFFYVWLRRSLKVVFPDLFATLAVPKVEELVATPYRHGGKEKAESFFLNGMTQAIHRLYEHTHPAIPVTIYYAFKQSETEGEGTASTGWETFLDAVIRAGFAICGTWPMRTERGTRSRGIGSNALASSIVLVCRPRPADVPTTSRRAFLRELNQVLPEALDEMTKGAGDDNSPVAPVDLSQAIIGPGMAVFSKYAAVLEADGRPMSVRTALHLINRFLTEDDFDADTQFCLHWFEQHGWKDGRFGEADTLARAKGTSVDGVKQSGVLYAAAGVVRLLKWADYASEWDPRTDSRLPVWEVLHQLVRIFKTDGETGAGAVLGAVQAKAEAARQLAYRLYTLCERAGWADDARAYNELITSWSAIESAAVEAAGPRQTELFGA